MDLHCAARESILEFDRAIVIILALHRARIRSLIFYAASYSMNAESVRFETNVVFTTAFFDVENACPMLKELDMLGPGKCGVH